REAWRASDRSPPPVCSRAAFPPLGFADCFRVLGFAVCSRAALPVLGFPVFFRVLGFAVCLRAAFPVLGFPVCLRAAFPVERSASEGCFPVVAVRFDAAAVDLERFATPPHYVSADRPPTGGAGTAIAPPENGK